MAANAPRNFRASANLHRAHVALLELRSLVPEPELCKKLGCSVDTLKRWAYLGVPNSRAAEVIQVRAGQAA